MKVKDIEISNIDLLQNSRTAVGNVADLMRSIEKDGLLHPIGVYEKGNRYILTYGFRRYEAIKKLGWKTIPAVIIEGELSETDFLIINTLENIHRKDISPIELGKVCEQFKKKGFANDEIAAKLHIPKTRVCIALEMYQRIPRKFRDMIGFINRGESNNGKISANVASQIVKMRLNQAELSKLLEYARKESLTLNRIYLLKELMKTGFTFEEAIKNMDTCLIRGITVRVDRKEYDKMGFGHKPTKRTLTDYALSILKGEEPVNKNLFI